MELLRPAVLALCSHGAAVVVVDLASAGSVRWSGSAAVLLLAVALLAVLVLRWSAPGVEPLLAVAVAWFVLGLSHHYLVGISPLWEGRALSGAGHAVWDAIFHLPAVALGARALHRAPAR